jgi:hypothetical protein
VKTIATMLLFVAPALFLAVVPARPARAQAAGTANMQNGKVTQGDNVTMDVTLDKVSTVAASIVVSALPEGRPTGGVNLSCTLDAGQNACNATARVPLNAAIGKWDISRITFTPVSGQEKVLSQNGHPSFEVVAHGEIVLPGTATISNIK